MRSANFSSDRFARDRTAASGSSRAFTLIELMVVVAIMGLILSMGIPSIAKFLNPHGFAKTVNDVVDTCTAARQQAILNQVKTEVVFHPLERRYELAGGKAIQMGDDVNIEMLDAISSSLHGRRFTSSISMLTSSPI